MPEIGRLLYRDREKQTLRFDGMVYGKKSPTDIDLMIDYEGKTFVWGEFKIHPKELPTGQKIVLDRLCDDGRNSGRRVLAFFAHHFVSNPEDDVICADCSIVSYRTHVVPPLDEKGNPIWHTPKQPITVLEAVDRFLDFARPDPVVDWLINGSSEPVPANPPF